MKRIFAYFAGIAAALAMTVSCSETGPAEEQKAALEIKSHTLASSAAFGDVVPFTVTVPEDAVAQSLTAALVKDGKQLSSYTVREVNGGVFSGELAIPYAKNMEEGKYDVMFMVLGTNSSDRAEKTEQIKLAYPKFSSVAFVYGSEKLVMSASKDGKWSYTGALPASLAGYFEAVTADGKTCTFGGANIDNVEFGSTEAMELYSYEAAIPEGTISFDVVTFAVKFPLNALWVAVPETFDAAYPGTVEVEFKKGQVVGFTGLGDLWVDVDFFDDNGDGTYTFRAEGGKYRLTNQADWGSLRTERLSANGDLGTFRWDSDGNITVNEAIWCLGNYNFGKPAKRDVRSGRLFSDWETFDGYCMAKIDDYKYQITLRVHNYASYKFFQTKLDWGDIYSSNYDLANSTLTQCYIISIPGSDGNFQQAQNEQDPNRYEYPLDGVVLRFTFDVTDPLAIKVLVEEAEM